MKFLVVYEDNNGIFKKRLFERGIIGNETSITTEIFEHIKDKIKLGNKQFIYVCEFSQSLKKQQATICYLCSLVVQDQIATSDWFEDITHVEYAELFNVISDTALQVSLIESRTKPKN